MRWVILADDHPPLDGGVATWTARVAEALQRDGEEVVVYARARPGLASAAAYPVVPVNGRSFGRWGGVWTALAVTRKLQAGDRVLATTWSIATWLRRPFDLVVHGSEVTRPQRRGFGRVCAAAERRFAVSSFLADALAARGYPTRVIPAPVSPGSVSADQRNWVFLGRATPLKGGDRFVRLVAAAGVQGTVIGAGPELSKWRALARKLGAQIRFLGGMRHGDAMQELSRHSLAFLLPRCHPDRTGAEGIGLSLIEAAAHGVATVGCRTPLATCSPGAPRASQQQRDASLRPSFLRRLLRRAQPP